MTITEEDIVIIKGLFNKGYSVAEIAAKMGMEQQQVLLVTKEFKKEAKTP